MTSIDFMEMYLEEKKKLKGTSKKSFFEKRDKIKDLNNFLLKNYNINNNNKNENNDENNIENNKENNNNDGEYIKNIYYFNNFISEKEEKYLLKEIYNNKEKWVTLNNRRLQNWGGI
jgi:hypothetical protein